MFYYGLNIDLDHTIRIKDISKISCIRDVIVLLKRLGSSKNFGTVTIHTTIRQICYGTKISELRKIKNEIKSRSVITIIDDMLSKNKTLKVMKRITMIKSSDYIKSLKNKHALMSGIVTIQKKNKYISYKQSRGMVD